MLVEELWQSCDIQNPPPPPPPVPEEQPAPPAAEGWI